MNEMEIIRGTGQELTLEQIVRENAFGINILVKGFRDFDRRMGMMEKTVKEMRDTAIIDPYEQYTLKEYVRIHVLYVIKEYDLEPSKHNLRLIYPAIWRAVKDRFKVPAYQWIRKEDFREAKSFITRFTVSTELLERLEVRPQQGGKA